MINALSRSAGRFIALMAGGLFLVSCAGSVDNSSAPSTEPATTTDVVEKMVWTLATETSNSDSPSTDNPTATIAELVEGGVSGEWSVRVDFPIGTGRGCIIDVTNLRSGDLLARDSVEDSDGEAHSHVIRFRYDGRAKNLFVRVTDAKSGAVLTESSRP